MCTVTFIPLKNSCFITSSRDEHVARPGAVAPEIYEHNGISLLYPKDAKAGGSWIAFSQAGNAAVLLNGAFVKHLPVPPYRMSRGLVFLDIIAHPQPECCFMEINLDGIEPFTIVLYVKGFLFEGRWDGEQKHFVQLDEGSAHIWSSATLYSPELIRRRKRWFEQWLTETVSPIVTGIFSFHRYAGDGDLANNILMNRDDQMLTVSITGIEMNIDGACMRHYDVKDDNMVQLSLSFEPITI